MAAATYYLGNVTDSGSNQQIYMRIYVRHGYAMKIPTGIWINPKRWGKKHGITIPAIPGDEQTELIEKKENLVRLTRFIDDELKKVDDKSTLYQDWGVKKVKEFNKPSKVVKEKTLGFFDIADDYLAKHKLSESRVKHFKVLIRSLKRYELYKRADGQRSFKLNINTLSYDQLADIEDFLTNEREVFKKYPEIYQAVPYSTKQSTKTYKPKKEASEKDKEKGMPKERGQNYISDMMTRFRSFVIWANDNEYTTNNPFKNYSVGESVYGTPIYISNDERKRLYETDMSDAPSLAVQRDIFVFQCLIGCRVSDLYKMTWNNVINGAIEYIPKKTKEDRVQTVRVPLSDTAREIMERYRDPERESLLPFISSQKYNDNIKEAFEKAGLDRRVTVINQRTRQEEQKPIYEVASSHMARRSFIGNIYKQVKDPNLVGALSGHKEGSKAFARYRDIDEDMKKELNVNVNGDTVWLTQAQMVELFERERSVITKHINNIFKEGELDEKSNVQKMHIANSDKPVNSYNLDVIISVGYRVKSQRGTQFRIWANRILKEYLVKGYAINSKLHAEQLEDMKNTVRLMSNVIETQTLSGEEATGLLKVIRDYTYALDTLDRYDYQQLTIDNTTTDEPFRATYEIAMEAIGELRDKFGSGGLFGNEKDGSFKSSINTIYQTFDGQELYPSIEEKAAMLLYLVVKNHSFSDGNKRIAAFLFLWFLEKNGILYKEDGAPLIANNTLVALTLMIAESNPEEMDAMVKVVVNLINKSN